MATQKTAKAKAGVGTVEKKAASKVIGPQFERKEPKKKVAAPKVAERDDTVCVALNHPTGIKFIMPDGRKVVFNGNATPLIGKEVGKLPIGAYGLTIVKADDWDYITHQYGGMKIFKNGLCFATRRSNDAKAEAEDRDDLRHGLEPVDIKKTATKEEVKE